MEAKKLRILKDILGSHYRSSDEYLFYCPYCDHHKRKFSVNIEKNVYKCWVCDTRGANVQRVVRRFGSYKQRQEWSRLEATVDYSLLETLFDIPKEIKQTVELPKEFLSLGNHDTTATGFLARKYLKERGLTKKDIIWWKAGYCSSGDYENRIIIPSFDDEGDLNYFVSRSYDKAFYPKYKNPPASKNIIFNDLFVDWSSDIILVEGIFDAIISGRNAVPILGSTLNEHSILLRKIVKEDAGVYVALDPDAKKKELEIIKTLLDFDIEVWKVEIEEYDDVGSMGRSQFQKSLEKATLITSDNYLLLTLVSSV